MRKALKFWWHNTVEYALLYEKRKRGRWEFYTYNKGFTCPTSSSWIVRPTPPIRWTLALSASNSSSWRLFKMYIQVSLDQSISSVCSTIFLSMLRLVFFWLNDVHTTRQQANWTVTLSGASADQILKQWIHHCLVKCASWIWWIQRGCLNLQTKSFAFQLQHFALKRAPYVMCNLMRCLGYAIAVKIWFKHACNTEKYPVKSTWLRAVLVQLLLLLISASLSP